MFIHKNTVCYNYSLPLNNERNISIFEGKYFFKPDVSFICTSETDEVSSILSKFPSKSNVAHVGGYVSLLHEAHGLCPSQHETP